MAYTGRKNQTLTHNDCIEIRKEIVLETYNGDEQFSSKGLSYAVVGEAVQ